MNLFNHLNFVTLPVCDLQPHILGRELDNVKLVCYFDAAAANRESPMNLRPSSLDPYLCSHLIYYQAKLDVSALQIVSASPDLDLDRGELFVEFL